MLEFISRLIWVLGGAICLVGLIVGDLSDQDMRLFMILVLSAVGTIYLDRDLS